MVDERPCLGQQSRVCVTDDWRVEESPRAWNLWNLLSTQARRASQDARLPKCVWFYLCKHSKINKWQYNVSRCFRRNLVFKVKRSVPDRALVGRSGSYSSRLDSWLKQQSREPSYLCNDTHWTINMSAGLDVCFKASQYQAFGVICGRKTDWSIYLFGSLECVWLQ